VVLSALGTEFETYAPGYLGSDYTFLDHEFIKHGSCGNLRCIFVYIDGLPPFLCTFQYSQLDLSSRLPIHPPIPTVLLSMLLFCLPYHIHLSKCISSTTHKFFDSSNFVCLPACQADAAASWWCTTPNSIYVHQPGAGRGYHCKRGDPKRISSRPPCSRYNARC
jgi:hypothetical protein